MTVLRSKILLVCTLVALLAAAPVALGDWNDGDPYNMHFPQLPSLYGWGVSLGIELADDWLCTETGPVSDIHFWYSWQGDNESEFEWVDVAIYSDMQGGVSGPNERLWSRTFHPTDFTVRYYGHGDQGWLEPLDIWLWPDHQGCYQMNIEGIDGPFVQEQDNVYWLGIVVAPSTGQPGWKTSLQHWNNGAVLQGGPDVVEPLTGESLDMAFVIESSLGDDCNYPVPVELSLADLPYISTNTTCGRDDDYNDTCLGDYDGGEDIIYEVNVTQAMDVRIILDPCGTISTGIVLDDSCPPDSSCLAQSTSAEAIPHGFCVHLEPSTYYIMIDSHPLSDCIPEFTLTVEEYSLDNDDCAYAEPVGDVVDQPFDTMCATFDGGGGCMTGPNIWYCYTATCTGYVTVSLCGSSYDTALAVYNGCACSPLGDMIACNDDYCGVQSQITFLAVVGNDYLIEVGGYSDYTGEGLLSVACERPPGDDCGDPVLVTPDMNPGRYTNTTCGRGDDYNNTCLGNYDGGEEIIYQLNLTVAGDYRIVLDPCGGL
ncbi:MAG: DUF7901 domain-containing protein [Planctomycetota bacterium]|jgi:hypothetical protein